MSPRWLVAAGLAVVTTLPLQAAVELGQPSPEVILPDQDGRLVNIMANYGERYVALAFYPKDDTAGCTREAQSVNKALAELEKSGVVVYGVSVQDVDSKKEFCNKYGLKQTMLSDPEKKVCEAFGTLNDRGMSNRVTVILDPSLTVRLIDKAVKVDTHAADIINAVNALREDDDKTALATLSKTATEVQPGVSLRLPDGWKPVGTGLVHPDNPKVGVRMGINGAGADNAAWMAAFAKDATILADRELPIVEGDVRQFTFGADAAGQVRNGVVWFHDGQATYLEGYAPAADANALARLVAEIVASAEY